MDRDEYNCIVYHGTLDTSVKSILSTGYRVNKPRKTDNHWLGHGIYFFAEYKLAQWWGITKAKVYNKKYNKQYASVVLHNQLSCPKNKIVDLDDTDQLDSFFEYCKEFEKALQQQNIQLDFSSDLIGKNFKKKKRERIIRERMRCTYLDYFKRAQGVAILMYTFDKSNPSYAASAYKCGINEMFGLYYKERQICVTTADYVSRIEVKNIKENDEEIEEIEGVVII